ncbi:MAG: hypothetical protein GC160_10675 [Acidobacteria bacterium]|nr:hypothetical protein [Acidobacteriota bacterium]
MRLYNYEAVTIVIDPELEKLIAAGMRQRGLSDAREVVEAALRSYLGAAPNGEEPARRDRVGAWLRWVDSHPDGPGLPAEAMGRDAIYD